MDKNSFGYKVVMDVDNHTVSVEETIGEHESHVIYLLDMLGDGHDDVAMACRAAAYYLLAKADGIQHSKDFYHEEDIHESVELMLKECRTAVE